MSEPVCPCDDRPTEKTISNPPGRDKVAYRVGNFISFRRALLRSLPGEQQLTAWRPGGADDLGVQMIEWWAYIGDVLTFYNERIANEMFLRTAGLPESLRRLIRTIGYRPRPGIAAQGQIVALAGGHRAFILPKGFAVDSKPGPGETPQTFELDADTTISPLGTVRAEVRGSLFAPGSSTFLVAGTSVACSGGDVLFLSSTDGSYPPVLLTVTGVAAETGEDGKKRTRVSVSAGAVPAGASARNSRIQYSAQVATPWSDPAAIFVPLLLTEYDLLTDTATHDHPTVDLAGIARDLHGGDSVVFTAPGQAPQLCGIGSIKEVVWYANHPSGSGPGEAPTGNNVVPIPVLHARLTLDALDNRWVDLLASLAIRFGWRSVGQLLDQAVMGYDGSAGALWAVAPARFPDGLGRPVIIADSLGAGMQGLGSTARNGDQLALSSLLEPPTTLKPPLTAHFNLLHVSRGKTVASEVLGSGDAAIAGQEFVLKNSPLTYLAKGDSYASTLAIRVDGRLWREAPSFYQQSAAAEVFVTREDENQKTHVQFGDGVNGARLPTGIHNVVATYRYGSGAKSPLSGELTVIGKPYPNLRAVQNPVPVGGGADPDPPDQIRRYAPPTVMTFGRAISGDDYEAIVAHAPGVTRARAVWSFDGQEQRAAVKIYVDDDQNALMSARSAIALSGDPHRHVVLIAASPIPISLSLSVLIDARASPNSVTAAVRTAMLDDVHGLFGAHRLQIGAVLFHSQIAAACLACDGALSMRGCTFSLIGRGGALVVDDEARHYPGEGGFYLLDPTHLSVVTEVGENAR